MRDYPSFLGGLILGVLLAIAGSYWYRNGFYFPRIGVNTPDGGTNGDYGPRPTATLPIRYGSFRIRAENVNMRRCPGFNCPEIGRLQYGSRVIDLGETQFIDDMEWVRIRAGNLEGWVSRLYLE